MQCAHSLWSCFFPLSQLRSKKNTNAHRMQIVASFIRRYNKSISIIYRCAHPSASIDCAIHIHEIFNKYTSYLMYAREREQKYKQKISVRCRNIVVFHTNNLWNGILCFKPQKHYFEWGWYGFGCVALNKMHIYKSTLCPVVFFCHTCFHFLASIPMYLSLKPWCIHTYVSKNAAPVAASHSSKMKMC